MNSEQNLLLGPVEWAVVTKYLFTPGFFLHLEDSGDEVFMDSMSFSDDPACCEVGYWPDLGERIRVRRFPDDGRGQIRVTGKASRLAGLTRGYPTRELGLPAGLGPIELGRVIEHRDRDILVRLEDSDRIGVLSEQTLLYESGRRVHERLTTYEDGEYRKHWPAVGARIQVQRLGVWPNGELRLAGRSMVSAPGWPLHSRADRSWNWSTKYTRVLPPQVVDRVRAVADAVSLRNWGQAEELTSDNRLDWEQADAFMTTYGGGTYTAVPDEFTQDMFASPFEDGGDWIDCLLWTERERPSDVEISLTIIPDPDAPDGLKASLVRMRAIGLRYPGCCDQRPRPATPAWTTLI